MEEELMDPTDRDLIITVPAWIDTLTRSFVRSRAQGRASTGTSAASPLADPRARFDSLEAQMRLTIELARVNVEHGGSPFGAAVFAGDSLVAAGVNCVLSSGLSIAHAEVVALMRAQKRLGVEPEHLSGPLSLVSSAEPCCQCFGALIWSGVERLVYGATKSDVEAIGFDEGPKPERWADVLRDKGIAVIEELCRVEACGPLQRYAARGGPIYGLRPGKDREG